MIADAQNIQAQPSSETQPTRKSVKFKSLLLSLWREALLPYLGTRLVLVLVGLLADFYILPLMKVDPIFPSHSANMHLPNALWLMWQRFDSGFYIGIAQSGYWPANTLHTYSNWAFYPLFPVLISPFGHLFGGSDTAWSLAGLLVSNICALVAVTYFYLLVRREFGAKIASLSVIFLALFPTGFFLSAIYSESAFLACSVACIYYARLHRWWLAGICGGLASLARAQGILLVVPLVWEYWQAISDRYAPLSTIVQGEQAQTVTLEKRIHLWVNSRLRGPWLAVRELRNWLSLFALALVPAGLLAFMIYGKIKTGDLLATFHNQKWGWGHKFTNPLNLLITSLQHPLPANPMDWNFWILNIIVAFVFLGLTVWAFRRLPITYALYTLVMVLLPLSSSTIKSISRYYVIVFPVFILFALWTANEERPQRRFILMTLFAMMEAVLMIFFVLGLPAIA